MSNKPEIVGSVLVEFPKQGDPKFTFKGVVDPQYIWTLGVHLKLAYDIQYMQEQRKLELENLEKKKKENAERKIREEKERVEAEKKAKALSDKRAKEEAEAQALKREEVRLLNERTELERILAKAKEKQIPDTSAIEKELERVNKALEKFAPVKKVAEVITK